MTGSVSSIAAICHFSGGSNDEVIVESAIAFGSTERVGKLYTNVPPGCTGG
jgi:hypothetical protein